MGLGSAVNRMMNWWRKCQREPLDIKNGFFYGLVGLYKRRSRCFNIGQWNGGISK